MSGLATEILLILLLLVLNGLFAMSEIAVVTARRIRLAQRADAGDRGARIALELAEDPTQFLSTVQVGITLIGILAGAFGGASIAGQLAELLRAYPAVAPYAEALGLGLVVAAITYLSLIFGELVPKRIALAAPERIASLVARPMRAVSRVTAPLVQLLTGSTNLMLRLLGVRAHMDPGITEEEVRATLEQGAESGVVQPVEHEVVQRVFRLGDRRVSGLMTPRPEIDWIDLAQGDEAVRAELGESPRSLVLVCRNVVDEIVGFVRAEDLLTRCIAGQVPDRAALETLARPPLFVPEAMPALDLLEALRRGRQHAAVVLDEYGGVSGIVTLDDVLEALVGTIPETDSEAGEHWLVQRADGSWLVDGQAPIADLEEVLDASLVNEERPGYETVGGFVMTALEHLPRVTDHFVRSNYRFEVVDMDGRRVDKVLVTRAASASHERQ